MKRILAFITALTISATGLAACSSGSDGSSDESMNSIELWMPTLANDNQDTIMWEEISQKFEAEHDVKVNVTIVPWDAYETKFLTGVSSGNGPDVGYMYPEMLGDYISKNQLVALDEFVTPEQQDNLLYLPHGKVQDKQFALPLLVGAARVIFYNKDLLDQAGVTPPSTWEEFEAAGEKLKAAGITPFVAPFGDKGRGVMNSNFFPFIWQNGGDLFAKDGKSTQFDSPEVIEAAGYLKNLMDKGILSPDSTGANVESTRKSFQAGEVAFIVESEAKASLWDDAGVNYGHIVSLSKKQEGTFFASDQLVMFNACADKQLCYNFMDYLTQGEQMAKFHERSPYEPVGKDETVAEPSEFTPIYTEKKDILHSLPIVPNSVGAYQTLYKNLQAMLTGQKTPEQAMKDAAEEGNRALAK